MIELLYTPANGTLPNGHQNTVGLTELRIVQAIKCIFNLNLKRAVGLAQLSHAFSEYRETPPKRASRSLRLSGRCFWHRLAEGEPFPQAA